MKDRFARCPATIAMCVVIVAIYLYEVAIGAAGNDVALTRLGALSTGPGAPADWRIISYAFLHRNLTHIVMNTAALFFIGSLVERRVGAAKWLAIYFVSAIVGGLSVWFAGRFGPPDNAVGASGAIFGIVAAALVLAFRHRDESSRRMRRPLAIFVAIAAGISFLPNVSSPVISAGLSPARWWPCHWVYNQPMTTTDPLRTHLVKLLDWHEAHVGFDAAVKGVPHAKQGDVPHGLHSPWQLLEHLRIAQHDIHDFCVNPNYDEDHKGTKWPDDYWPKSPAPPSAHAWTESVAAYVRDREAMKRLVRDSSIDLFATIPHGTGQTYFREVMLVVDHGAYHVGQLVLIRRLLGIWPA